MTAARKESDRRVRKVLAALAEAQAYDDGRRAKGEEVSEGEVDYLVFRVLDHETLDDWQAEPMRAFMRAACMLAPSSTLTGWAARAVKYVEDHRQMMAEHAYEDATGRPYPRATHVNLESN